MKNSFQYRIYYEDTDAGGIVYYANYLKFLERARTDFLLSLGISQSTFSLENIFFVVKKCEIEYISPAKLEDIITVSCEIAKLSNVCIEFYQSVNVEEKTIVNAKIQVVCVKSVAGNFKPHRIPETISNLIK